MKKKVLFIIAAVLFTASANAQRKEVKGYDDTKHEIAISSGIGTNTQLIGMFTKLTEIMLGETITTTFTGGTLSGHTSYGDEDYVFPLSLEYFYHYSGNMGVGAILCYNGYSSDMYGNLKNNTTGETKKTLIGESKATNLTFMPAFKYDWLRRSGFGMYSKVAVGATLMLEKEKITKDGADETINDKSKIMFNWQASLLGIEAGIPNFRAFAELGFGEQGIVLAGLRCKF